VTPVTDLLHRRVDQIAVLVPDLETAMDAYIANFGVTFGVFEANEKNSSFSGSSPQFRLRIAVALVGLLSIELIQPVSGVTLHSQHLESRGSGIHHIGVYVANLAKARKAFLKRGYQQILEGRIRGLGKFAYFEVPGMHCILEPLELSLDLPRFLTENANWYSGNHQPTV
jgi:hypothetical protein